MQYTRVNSDINGNPRYVFHFFEFLSSKERHDMCGRINDMYSLALSKSRAIGGKKYRGKDFGGGIVLQSYNIDETITDIKNIANG